MCSVLDIYKKRENQRKNYLGIEKRVATNNCVKRYKIIIQRINLISNNIGKYLVQTFLQPIIFDYPLQALLI